MELPEQKPKAPATNETTEVMLFLPPHWPQGARADRDTESVLREGDKWRAFSQDPWVSFCRWKGRADGSKAGPGEEGT